ncbi:hypothetical protein [Parasitella parasitica]|uniref:Uncharacterized protein n=1 Tax=Parasitella parasitica TaxID=35722 RepID=A0A0B7NPL1_9FUNG|nr:hypothetical protein [Parasitella parasitica]
MLYHTDLTGFVGKHQPCHFLQVERQPLSHSFIAEDKASLVIEGANSVHVVGTSIVYGDDDDSEMEIDGQNDVDDDDDDDDYNDDDDDERETITGQPRYANYLSDLLGPDLPDDDDDDYEDDDPYDADEFGTMAFRDPTDNEFLGGFELRHFNLAPNMPGFDDVDLRQQEKCLEDSLLNDNIATGLVNALLNSGDEFQMEKGREFLKKLKKQRKQRLQQ